MKLAHTHLLTCLFAALAVLTPASPMAHCAQERIFAQTEPNSFEIDLEQLRLEQASLSATAGEVDTCRALYRATVHLRTSGPRCQSTLRMEENDAQQTAIFAFCLYVMESNRIFIVPQWGDRARSEASWIVQYLQGLDAWQLANPPQHCLTCDRQLVEVSYYGRPYNTIDFRFTLSEDSSQLQPLRLSMHRLEQLYVALDDKEHLLVDNEQGKLRTLLEEHHRSPALCALLLCAGAAAKLLSEK